MSRDLARERRFLDEAIADWQTKRTFYEQQAMPLSLPREPGSEPPLPLEEQTTSANVGGFPRTSLGPYRRWVPYGPAQTLIELPQSKKPEDREAMGVFSADRPCRKRILRPRSKRSAP